jgi:hypothetical protein
MREMRRKGETRETGEERNNYYLLPSCPMPHSPKSIQILNLIKNYLEKLAICT